MYAWKHACIDGVDISRGVNMASQIRRLLVTALRSIEEEAAREQAPAPRPKSRAGKKTVVAHVAPEVAWQLKKLALDRGSSVQRLLEESLQDLFEKYHLPRL
jgi:hypothetical protein